MAKTLRTLFILNILYSGVKWQVTTFHGVRALGYNNARGPSGSSSGFIETCGVAKVAPATPNCALSNQAIQGGLQSLPLSWPWMVSLNYKGGHISGGAIINSDTVITAAHCTYSRQASDLAVSYGNINLDAQTIIKNPVKEIRQHENFVRETVVNDIAILKLANKITFTDAIRPICLPTAADIPIENAPCYATGWGVTNNPSIATNILREVCLNVQKCGNMVGIKDGMMCAKSLNGHKDTCEGDSGGPLACKTDGVWKLGGIISWGNCTIAGDLGVYTDVSQYVDWIQENMI